MNLLAPSAKSLLREFIVATFFAIVGFNVALSVWAIADAWITLPLIHRLERAYGVRGAVPVLQAGGGFLVVAAISTAVGFAFGCLTRMGRWSPLTVFLVVLVLATIEWPPKDLSALRAFAHWSFWVFGIVAALVFTAVTRSSKAARSKVS